MSILLRVQTNPDIAGAHSDYVSALVDRVKQFIVDYCHLPRFPELCRGFSQSGTNPALDLTGVDDAMLRVSVNGSEFYDIEPRTGLCATGAATAAELQAQLRAVPVPDFEEATVTYAGAPPDDYYLIESGKYGEVSWVTVRFDPTRPALARAMKLSPLYGGVELPGSEASGSLEEIAVGLTEQWYRRLGVEGASRGPLPTGAELTMNDIEPYVLRVLQQHRRLAA